MSLMLQPRVVQSSGGSQYVAAPIEQSVITPFLNMLDEIVGPDRASLLRELKSRRDGDGEYHVTIITPPEFARLKSVSLPKSFECTLVGIGRQRILNAEAYYVVVELPEAQRFRTEIGLGHHDFHITLGFHPKDIHGVSKGPETLFDQSPDKR